MLSHSGISEQGGEILSFNNDSSHKNQRRPKTTKTFQRDDPNKNHSGFSPSGYPNQGRIKRPSYKVHPAYWRDNQRNRMKESESALGPENPDEKQRPWSSDPRSQISFIEEDSSTVFFPNSVSPFDQLRSNNVKINSILYDAESNENSPNLQENQLDQLIYTQNEKEDAFKFDAPRATKGKEEEIWEEEQLQREKARSIEPFGREKEPRKKENSFDFQTNREFKIQNTFIESSQTQKQNEKSPKVGSKDSKLAEKALIYAEFNQRPGTSSFNRRPNSPFLRAMQNQSNQKSFLNQNPVSNVRSSEEKERSVQKKMTPGSPLAFLRHTEKAFVIEMFDKYATMEIGRDIFFNKLTKNFEISSTAKIQLLSNTNCSQNPSCVPFIFSLGRRFH